MYHEYIRRKGSLRPPLLLLDGLLSHKHFKTLQVTSFSLCLFSFSVSFFPLGFLYCFSYLLLGLGVLSRHSRGISVWIIFLVTTNYLSPSNNTSNESQCFIVSSSTVDLSTNIFLSIVNYTSTRKVLFHPHYTLVSHPQDIIYNVAHGQHKVPASPDGTNPRQTPFPSPDSTQEATIPGNHHRL